MSNLKHASWVSSLIGFALSTMAHAQGLPPRGGGLPNPLDDRVVVRVWPGDRCSVLDRSTTCSRVSSVLQRSSQVSRDTVIEVYAEAQDEDTVIRASQVATDIKAAGYRRVVSVHNAPGQ